MKVQEKKWKDCLGDTNELVVCMCKRKNIISNYKIIRYEHSIITEIILWNIDKNYCKRWVKVKDIN